MTAKEFNDLVKESGKYGDHARASYLMGLAAGAADGGWEMLQKAAAYAEELEAEVNRLKARVLDLLDKATA